MGVSWSSPELGTRPSKLNKAQSMQRLLLWKQKPWLGLAAWSAVADSGCIS